MLSLQLRKPQHWRIIYVNSPHSHILGSRLNKRQILIVRANGGRVIILRSREVNVVLLWSSFISLRAFSTFLNPRMQIASLSALYSLNQEKLLPKPIKTTKNVGLLHGVYRPYRKKKIRLLKSKPKRQRQYNRDYSL